MAGRPLPGLSQSAMKTHRLNRLPTASVLAGALLLPAYAGSPEPPPAPTPEPEKEYWIKPTLDIRARYEFGHINDPALESSNAFTTRERVGLMTAEWYGLSAFVEGEFTQAIVDDYDSGPGGSTTPNEPDHVGIFDPETNELNRAWVQWKGYDTTLKGGRQRIILDNAAFVGNVGWRQNEQTYDAAMIKNSSVDGLTLFYAYANRANRIFGSDATGALRSFAGDVHLFNASYSGLEGTTFTGYAYLMDFNKTAANAGYISNNTFGGIVSTSFGDFTLRSEGAYQTDTDSSPVDVDDSWYAHVTGEYALGCHTLGVGWEYLDRDFVTPLATVHAFNGFADVFIGRRIGLVTNPGLNDIYLSHKWKTPFWGINFSQFVHLFGDNNTEFDFGWEYDAVLAKKFDEHFTAIAKFAYYDADSFSYDTTRVSVELNYKF